ncbi:MAG: stage III sporulation protein AA [Cellulosilyticaceae bacterium]
MNRQLLDNIPIHLKEMFLKLPPSERKRIQEIRLRVGKPLIIHTANAEHGLNHQGLCKITESYKASDVDLETIIKSISGFSFYAVDDEIKQGYMTIEGGHRIGVVGKVVVEDGKIKTIKHISALNIRIAHEAIGCSQKVLPALMIGKRVRHTLIVSPPKCGKTTLLRDLIRQLSNDSFTVGVVDERSEIAGCYKGIPQNDVGIRTDVLDGCTKVEGMRMLLRAMAPDIIAVDEISSEKDMIAVEEVLGAGVTILCTTHGLDYKDCLKKPILKRMIDNRLFEKIVVLSNKQGPCTVEEIIDVRNGRGGVVL